MLRALSDQSLLQLFRTGSEDAASVLYGRYAERLDFLASRGLGADMRSLVGSEDVVQSIFRTFFRRAAAGDYVTDNTVMLGTGQYKIVVNVLAESIKSIPEIEFTVNAAMVSSDAGPLPNNPVGNPGTGPGATFPYVYPNNMTSTKPLVVMPPYVIVNPVVPKPPVIPVLTWQQMMMMMWHYANIQGA